MGSCPDTDIDPNILSSVQKINDMDTVRASFQYVHRISLSSLN